MSKKKTKGLESFLDAERKSYGSSSNQPGGSGQGSGSGSSNPIQDLIKCFCGVCESYFKRTNIEYALKANGEELLRDPDARSILSKFLIFRRGNSRSKSPAFNILELFELCEAILQKRKNLEDDREELEDLLFTEEWEEMLTEAIDNQTLSDFFHALMRECAIRLESTEDYPLFKEELRKKLK